MGLNKHMAAAVKEMDGDIEALSQKITELGEEAAGYSKEIVRLQDARKSIDDLYGGGGETPDEPKAPKARKAKAAAVEPAADAAVVKRGRQLAPAALAAVAKLKGMELPITAEKVVEATGQDQKFASNLLSKLKARGWLASTGWGKFERTAAFPA